MSAPFQAMRGMANLPWFSPFTNMRPLPPVYTTIPTASATSHTKGAWAQIVSPTSEEVGFLFLRVSDVATSATETSMLFDIGIGAAGSETAIMENVAVGGAAVTSGGSHGIILPLPVRVPSGSRLSCRIQSLISSDTCTLQTCLIVVPARQMLPASVDVIGTNTANSRGTAFSGTTNTWVEITASTSRRYRGIFLVPSIIGTDITSIAGALRLGVGAAGSETELGRVYVDWRNTEWVFHAPTVFYAPIACDVPAGSRLVVANPGLTNPDRYGVCLIGIP